MPAMLETRQAMKQFVFSFVYFVSMVPVIVGVWQVLMFVEYNIGFRGYEPGVGLDDFTTLYFNGDVVAVAAIFIIGGTAFGSLSWSLVRFVVILGMMFSAEYLTNLVEGNPMYEVPLVVGILLVAAFAICVDALVFGWQQRFESTSLGDGT